eukprot:29023-Chlamydomonas_euryale.AAC.18
MRLCHNWCVQVASLLRSPPAMPPPVPTPTAAKPPNYRRNNAAAVKEMSVLNGLRKAAEAEVRAGPAARWAPSKPAPRPQVPQPRPVSDGSHRDFVRENRVVAPVRQASPAKAADDGSKYLTKPDFGRVPNYLLQRKVQLLEQEEEQLRLREAASIPPGARQHRLVCVCPVGMEEMGLEVCFALSTGLLCSFFAVVSQCHAAPQTHRLLVPFVGMCAWVRACACARACVVVVVGGALHSPAGCIAGECTQRKES